MSITFFIQGGPTKEVQELDYDGQPMFNDDGSPLTYTEHIGSFNWSNSNAAYVFSVFGYQLCEDGCGLFTVNEFPKIRSALLRALNTNVVGRPTTTSYSTNVVLNEDAISEIKPGLTITRFGLSDEDLQERLRDLFDLVIRANELNKPIQYC
jgi:hypothetical protein